MIFIDFFVTVSFVLSVYAVLKISNLKREIQNLQDLLATKLDKPLPDVATEKQDKSNRIIKEQEPSNIVDGRLKVVDKVDNNLHEVCTSNENSSSKHAPSLFFNIFEGVKKTKNVEFQLGARLPVWIGAIAIIAASAFLMKFSLENSLLGPLAKILLGYFFGALSIAASFVVFYKYRISNYLMISNALLSVGIASLYISTFVAGSIYSFLPDIVAFVIMATVSILAVFLSIKKGYLVAYLGLLGGAITPVLVSSQDPSVAGFLIYITLVFASALFVACKQKWEWFFALSTTIFYVWLAVAQNMTSSTFVYDWVIAYLGLASAVLLFFVINKYKYFKQIFWYVGGLVTLAINVFIMQIMFSLQYPSIAYFLIYLVLAFSGAVFVSCKNKFDAFFALSATIFYVWLAVAQNIASSTFVYDWVIAYLGLASAVLLFFVINKYFVNYQNQNSKQKSLDTAKKVSLSATGYIGYLGVISVNVLILHGCGDIQYYILMLIISSGSLILYLYRYSLYKLSPYITMIFATLVFFDSHHLYASAYITQFTLPVLYMAFGCYIVYKKVSQKDFLLPIISSVYFLSLILLFKYSYKLDSLYLFSNWFIGSLLFVLSAIVFYLVYKIHADNLKEDKALKNVFNLYGFFALILLCVSIVFLLNAKYIAIALVGTSAIALYLFIKYSIRFFYPILFTLFLSIIVLFDKSFYPSYLFAFFIASVGLRLIATKTQDTLFKNYMSVLHIFVFSLYFVSLMQQYASDYSSYYQLLFMSLFMLFTSYVYVMVGKKYKDYFLAKSGVLLSYLYGAFLFLWLSNVGDNIFGTYVINNSILHLLIPCIVLYLNSNNFYKLHFINPSLLFSTVVVKLLIALLVFIFILLNTRYVFQGAFFIHAKASNIEIYTYSAVIMLYGLALLVIGMIRDLSVMRYTSLAVLGLGVVKVFLYDVANLSDLFRIISLLCLGVFLLALSWFYSKFVFAKASNTRSKNTIK